MVKSTLILTLVLAILTACSPRPLAATALAPTAGLSPTHLPATATHSPTQIPPPTPTSITIIPSSISPQILPTAWDDRSFFKGDLIAAAQSILSALPGASVYHIDLTIADDLASIIGKEEVLYTNRETVPLTAIHFRLFPNLLGGKMTVSHAWLDDQPVTSTLAGKNSDLTIQLPAPLAPGAQAVVRLEFAADVPGRQPNGYDTFTLDRNIASLAQFYPLIPAYDDSGWHTEIPPSYGDVTYADTSFYLVRVTAPADLVIAATGSPVQQTKTGSSQSLTYAAGPVRDFYIQASPDFILASVQDGEITLNTYVPAAQKAAASQTLDIARAAIDSFTKRFGPYPYTVLNIAANPTQDLSMEYPQEVSIALELYKSTGQESPTDIAGMDLEGVIVHEIAHQWWYGIIGNDQVNQPWLDEAMTQYSIYLYYLDAHGPSAADSYHKQWVSSWQHGNNAPTPIGQSVFAYKGGMQYGDIIYGRGPLFVEALAKQMGDADFSAFLKGYYQAYQYGVSTTSGYEQLAENTCSCDLHPLFGEWVYP